MTRYTNHTLIREKMTWIWEKTLVIACNCHSSFEVWKRRGRLRRWKQGIKPSSKISTSSIKQLLLLSIVDGCFSTKKTHTSRAPLAPHSHPTRTWTSKLWQVTNVGDRIFDVNVGRRTSALTVSPSWRPASARVDVPLSTYGYQHLQPGLDKVLEWKYLSWWNPTW